MCLYLWRVETCNERRCCYFFVPCTRWTTGLTVESLDYDNAAAQVQNVFFCSGSFLQMSDMQEHERLAHRLLTRALCCLSCPFIYSSRYVQEALRRHRPARWAHRDSEGVFGRRSWGSHMVSSYNCGIVPLKQVMVCHFHSQWQTLQRHLVSSRHKVAASVKSAIIV